MAKTPDSATIYANETATFTIAVTNNGPGTANNVVINDPLPNGAALTWTTATVGCSITGSGASQALSCTVATLTQGSTFTAVVKAVTSLGATTCPGLMNNTATAKGDNTAQASDTGSINCEPPPLGIGGGHFDFDIYYFKDGKYDNKKHIHQYDNKWNVTGVNMLNASEPASTGECNPAHAPRRSRCW